MRTRKVRISPEAKFERVAMMNIVFHHLDILQNLSGNTGKRAELLDDIWDKCEDLDRELKKDIPRG